MFNALLTKSISRRKSQSINVEQDHEECVNGKVDAVNH